MPGLMMDLAALSLEDLNIDHLAPSCMILKDCDLPTILNAPGKKTSCKIPAEASTSRGHLCEVTCSHASL